MAVASNDGGGPQPEPETLLETALRHCERVTADPAAGAAALDAASAAAAVLLRLAETSELETAVSAATAWASALVPQLEPWEAALGAQPGYPEKAVLISSSGRSFDAILGPLAALGPLPYAGTRREPGTSTSPQRAAARSQAAAVLILLDAAVACLQALSPAPAAQLGAAPSATLQPHPLEAAAAEVFRRLEDTGLPYAARAAGEHGEAIGASTADGIRAVRACCSLAARLLRLATARGARRRAAAAGEGDQPSQAASEGDLPSEDEDVPPLERWSRLCAPQTLRQVVDTLHDAAAVLSYWVPRPGDPASDTWRCACLSFFELVQLIWVGDCCLHGDLLENVLEYGTPYSKKLVRFIALMPAFAAHKWLSQQAPALAARGPAAAADVAAWAELARPALSLMTEAFAERAAGVVAGVCAGGPYAGFSSAGVSRVLEDAAEQLRALPALLGAVSSPASQPLAAALADAPHAPATVAAWHLHEVVCMLVQLVSRPCTTLGLTTSYRPLIQVQLTAALALLPAMVRWPLDLAAGDGTALRACSQAQAPPPDNPEGTGMFSLWAEWEVALLLLAGFIASLGEELEAGAAGAPRGTRKCPEGGGLQSGLVPDGSAAGQVARRTVKWPPPDPAPLAAAAAAALLLLSRWHALRAVLVPEAFAERAAGARSGTVSLDLQRDLPKACRQLVAAAAAALDGSRKSRLMRQALPAALDAAATACKLVRLACCDAAHWALLGAAAAANAGSPEGRPAAYEPYQPVALALAAAGAGERGVRRLLLAQGALQQPEAAYLRRRALALALQLVSALEAAAAATGPVAEEACSAAAAPGGGGPSVQRVLASLLETGGACQAGETATLLEACSLEAALAAARELAGPPVRQQLALAALPCADPACTAAAPGAGEAALRTSRCSRCLLSRYCSALCAASAWQGHKACCRKPADPEGVAAAAAAAPARPPANWPGPERQRAKACPVCGQHLAADGSPPGGQQHIATCAAARSERLAAARAAHGNDPAAAAAALPEVLAQSSSGDEAHRVGSGTGDEANCAASSGGGSSTGCHMM